MNDFNQLLKGGTSNGSWHVRPIAYIVPMGKGLELFIYRELEELERRGIQVILYATKFKHGDVLGPKPSWRYRYLTGLGLALRAPWILLRALARPALLLHALRNNSVVDLVFALCYAPLMKRAHCSQIHCHFGDHKLFIGYYCKRLTSLPLSVTIHSHELHVNPNPRMFDIAIHECDRVFAISQLAADLLVQRHGVPMSRVELSRLFVDMDDWRPARPIRVLTVARFEPQKGFHDLFAAAKLLTDISIEFVVVGFGPLDVRALARNAGVADKVVFYNKLGPRQLRMIYQSCDIYCLPSISHTTQGKEGIPVVLMEAMACGLPVVATRCGAVPEIVLNTLVDEGAPDQLAAAIRVLALDSDLRRRQGAANRHIVERDYSIANLDRFAEHLLSLGEGGSVREG